MPQAPMERIDKPKEDEKIMAGIEKYAVQPTR
jgi:hypothetical protein